MNDLEKCPVCNQYIDSDLMSDDKSICWNCYSHKGLGACVGILDDAIESQKQRVKYLNDRWGINGTGMKDTRRKKRKIAEYILEVLKEKKMDINK